MKVDLIYDKLINEYPLLALKLNDKEKNKIFNKYKKKHNLIDEDLEEIDLKDIINIKILLKRILANIGKYNTSKKI